MPTIRRNFTIAPGEWKAAAGSETMARRGVALRDGRKSRGAFTRRAEGWIRPLCPLAPLAAEVFVVTNTLANSCPGEASPCPRRSPTSARKGVDLFGTHRGHQSGPANGNAAERDSGLPRLARFHPAHASRLAESPQPRRRASGLKPGWVTGPTPYESFPAHRARPRWHSGYRPPIVRGERWLRNQMPSDR